MSLFLNTVILPFIFQGPIRETEYIVTIDKRECTTLADLRDLFMIQVTRFISEEELESIYKNRFICVLEAPDQDTSSIDAKINWQLIENSSTLCKLKAIFPSPFKP